MSTALHAPLVASATGPRFVQQRHVPSLPLERQRPLILACVPMRSHVNLSQIARTASACAAQRLIVCGNAGLNAKIARDAVSELPIERRRSLRPVLLRLAAEGYRIVGLEQTTNSTCLHQFTFPRRTVLVVGNERSGLPEDVLATVHDVVEIPVWGLPHSHNAATAADMAMYEYCRQFPTG